MSEIGLELIGRRLDAIQTELREFKFAVDVDRRDAISWRNSLVTELGAKLATFELRIDNRLAHMDDNIGAMDGRLTHKVDEIGERLVNIEALLSQLLNK